MEVKSYPDMQDLLFDEKYGDVKETELLQAI